MNVKTIEIDVPVEIFVTPRIANKYIHFDFLVFYQGKEIGYVYSRINVYETGNEGTFPISIIEKYLVSEDKKSFRKENWCFQEYLTREYFDVFGLKFYCHDQDFIDQCGLERPICNFIGDKFGAYNILTHDVDIIGVVSLKICPTCGDLFCEDFDRLNIQKYKEKPFIQFKRCFCCSKHRCGTVFLSASNHASFNRITNKDPRAFLYEKKNKPSKSFFKKYVRKHLHRVLKLGAPSKAQVTFFRSWLGAKDLTALAAN